MRPLIGIPCVAAERAQTLRRLYGNNQAYVKAIEEAGGIALLIPPQIERSALEQLCGLLDGLLLSGGEDVAPTLYGEEQLPECGEADPERDSLEWALARLALERDLPVFGICRGMQMLNVAAGGTLYQDVPSQRPASQRHEWSDSPRDLRAHEIAITPGSRLAQILGSERAAVNSLHHQAVARPGADVAITAVAPDGVAEALEIGGRAYALAVQYHPEELYTDDEASRKLFAAFVQAAEAYAGRKP